MEQALKAYQQSTDYIFALNQMGDTELNRKLLVLAFMCGYNAAKKPLP